ncbi:sigma-70 family RNA polymerase sigma factor [Paenibacillus sp. FJAT-26967]|uniref:sigma-70 family RNA polymerase sigma factor n=1 Tax=Paenibacillus sp. FJAT-26967 TaxID=1729690 RepID=UPI000A73C511|nr:sigma-70 family RNA polymerase sigma factor [Paenibacillus sp. FJAT-26967]
MKNAQRGDEKAYIKLFQQFEEELYRIAYVYLKNQEDALDAIQETAYRSFKSIRSLQEPEYFRTWLVRIAIRCSIDLLRKRSKSVIFTRDYLSLDTITADDQGDIPLSVSLKDLIDLLDEDEKSVILLRFYQDYTIKETAEILEIPLGTAKTILYRSLKKLRKLTVEGDICG